MRFLPRMIPCSFMTWIWSLQACIYHYVFKNYPKLVQSGVPARYTNILNENIAGYIATRLTLLSITNITLGGTGGIYIVMHHTSS